MAARFFDMALDDSVAARKQGRGGSGGGAYRKNDRSNRSSPYHRQESSPARWTHDKFDGDKDRRGTATGGKSFTNSRDDRNDTYVMSNAKTVTNKIIVENLHYAVSLADVKALFEHHAGPVKYAMIKYDNSGRSTGVANITFNSTEDSAKAIKALHGMTFDGEPMKITYAPVPQKPTSNDHKNNNSNTNNKNSKGAAPNKKSVFDRLGASESSIAMRLGELNPIPVAVSNGNNNSSNNTNSRTNDKGGRRNNNHNNNNSLDRNGNKKPIKQNNKQSNKVPTVEELDAEMDTYMGDGNA